MGKFCKKCQSETERYKNGDCKPCAKVRMATYQITNKGKVAAYQAEYRLANRGKVAEYQSAYYAKNREQLNVNSRAYYRANREQAAAYQSAYKSANKEKIAEWFKAYRALHQEKIKAYKAAYRASHRAERAAYLASHKEEIKASQRAYRTKPEVKVARRIHQHNRCCREVGKLSTNIKNKLFKLQRGKCACCGVSLGDDYHLDHIMPLALGGVNEDWNMQLLTSTCNQQKHAKHPVNFMRQRGFLL